MRLMAMVTGFGVMASSAWAGPVGYAQSSGYFKRESRPTLYQPLNLLDGRGATAWCTPTSDPLNDALTFGFKGGPTTLSELVVTTGNNFDETTFATFARARKLSIRVPGGLKTLGGGTFVMLEDKRGPQTVAINPPITGQRIIIEILDMFPAEDPDEPVCISDIVFMSEGKALNGSWLTPKLKYDKSLAPLLGTWFSGSEGNPNKFLAFDVDGAFRYSFEPFDQLRDKPVEITGTYEVAGDRITLDVPGKGKVQAKVRREASKRGRGQTLVLDGELPAELKQPFRSAP